MTASHKALTSERPDRIAHGERWVPLAANSRASVLASSRSVFARAWQMPVSDGLATSTRTTCGSMIRAISHAFPVTSSATRFSPAPGCPRTTRAAPASSRSDRPSEAHRPRPARSAPPAASPHRELLRSSHGSGSLSARAVPWLQASVKPGDGSPRRELSHRRVE